MTDKAQQKSTTRRLLQGLGGLLILGGLVLVFAPTLVSDPGPAADTYAAVERRVRWGALIGIGACMMVLTSFKPWVVALFTFVFWMSTGYLVARVIGMALEGIDSKMQWTWLAIELVLMVVILLFQQKKYPDHSLFRL